MALDFDDNFPEYLEIKNSSGSFKYLQGRFYSVNEEIGYRQFSTEKSCWEMFIYGKTSRYGAFFNYTVSKHIGYLINFVKQHYHYKSNWKLVDAEKQVITGKKSWGKKFSDFKYECPICLDEKQKGKILMCGHRFCKESTVDCNSSTVHYGPRNRKDRNQTDQVGPRQVKMLES